MSNNPVLFCNIGWMDHYQGPAEISGGGSYNEDDLGHEACNFLGCSDGYTYGYVQTPAITLKRLGLEDKKQDFVDPVDVIWMALRPKGMTESHPQPYNRRVVGWYRNARVFHKHQEHRVYPSKQHKQVKFKSFIIKARSNDVRLLQSDERMLSIPKGLGWPGRASLWYPDEKVDGRPDIADFLHDVRNLLDDVSGANNQANQTSAQSISPATDGKSLVKTRVGQSAFRAGLFEKWDGCSLTECAVPELLKASHIKPWAESNDTERLDTDNGLLLMAHLDAAFDKGLISFKGSGKVIISDSLSAEDKKLLGLDKHKQLCDSPSNQQQQYLEYHRTHVFKKESE